MSQIDENSSSINCLEIEQILNDKIYFILMPIQMILLYPCDLLTPMWLVLTIYAPYYINSIAYPSFHFCIMIERVRATILAEKYEKEGRLLGIYMCLIIWLISTIYYIYLSLATLADTETFGQPQGATYITSKYNALPLFCMTILTLILMIVTTICDWRITVLNRKIKNLNKNPTKYSLSRNFQLNENTLSMRLIFPLDLSYALFYSLYIGIVLVLRAYKYLMPLTQYILLYNAVDTFIFLHIAITIIVYISFVNYIKKYRNKTTKNTLASEQAKLHFKQLKEMWK
uniref:G_PROTEIN_RECEP_F1_2 domain-containing protein n=1 Tax=Meloidogyne hapla TaxID=6305 RepID=A0A1I8B6M3_MELHA